MIKIIGNDIKRNGEKIGWIRNNDIYEISGEKLGYFLDNDIYNVHGRKMGYILGNHIKTADGSREINLEENLEFVSGGSITNIARAAIRLLFGD